MPIAHPKMQPKKCKWLGAGRGSVRMLVVRKLPILSEWGWEFSADGHWKGRDCVGVGVTVRCWYVRDIGGALYSVRATVYNSVSTVNTNLLTPYNGSKIRHNIYFSLILSGDEPQNGTIAATAFSKKLLSRYCLMKTEVGRNWYQLIHFDKLSFRQVSFFGPQWTMDTIRDER